MREISFDHPHQKKHFDFFNTMNHPHFNITANVDITHLRQYLKAQQIPFTPAILFLVCKAANSIREFRWRIREGKIVEHNFVHPSITVPTLVSEAFSFCYVDYQPEFTKFAPAFAQAQAAMKDNPSFEDDEARDDFLFISAIPWISFTSFQHAMHFHPSDSVPRIVWGKYFEENGKIKMPLSVQVHHAILDGRHVGQYFDLLQQLMDEVEQQLI